MVVALFTGALGFIFAFVANADNATPGLISFACVSILETPNYTRVPCVIV